MAVVRMAPESGDVGIGAVDLNSGYVINTSTDCYAPFTSFSTTVANAGNRWWRVGVSVNGPDGPKIDSVTPGYKWDKPRAARILMRRGRLGSCTFGEPRSIRDRARCPTSLYCECGT